MKIYKRSLLCCLLFIAFFNQSNAQLLNDSVLIEGHYRYFHYDKPAVKPGASLLFLIHGSGGKGADARNDAKALAAISEQENLLLVYPDAYKNYWNECRKAANSVANLENINENAFFDSMINYFQKHFQIDKKKVFAQGMSAGGHMAYKFALTMPDKFRAVTAVIANLPEADNLDCPEMHKAIPIMIINGTDDKTNPYNGGLVAFGNFNMGKVRSTDSTFHYWSSLAGYTGEPIFAKLPDTDPNDGKTIERYTFKKKGKPEVVLLKVLGGHHDYPNDINVFLEGWAFFKRQLTK